MREEWLLLIGYNLITIVCDYYDIDFPSWHRFKKMSTNAMHEAMATARFEIDLKIAEDEFLSNCS